MLALRVLRQLKQGQQNAAILAIGVLLVFAFLLGGASRENVLRLAVVELVGLAVLVVAIPAAIRANVWRTDRTAALLAITVVMIPLIQLAPLPPAVWQALPGRDQLALVFELTARSPPWLPISLTPELTWRATLALIPPLAAFLIMAASQLERATHILFLLLALCALSLGLGLVQLASGGDRLYPWETTAAGQIVGFFANRNHMATLCLVTLPFAVVFAAGGLRRADRRWRVFAGLIYAAAMIVGLIAIRSRAGVVLLLPVAAMAGAAAWVAAGRSVPKAHVLAIAAILALVTMGAVGVSLDRLLLRFENRGVHETRWDGWPVVLQAAEIYLPLGSGIGSFDAVYRSVEPLEQVDPTFFNHAHNEYLEILLEAGWLGVAGILAFLYWFMRRGYRAWRAPAGGGADLQRAATIAVGAMLLHSIVDYPLRTETLAVAFALCCGLLAAPLTSSRRRASLDRRDGDPA